VVVALASGWQGQRGKEVLLCGDPPLILSTENQHDNRVEKRQYRPTPL
jgi:hypothetical protein